MVEFESLEDQPKEETEIEMHKILEGIGPRGYALLFIVASIVLVLDQWTKNWVRTNIPYGGQWMPWEWLEPYARLVHWSNTGAAFGMFQDGSLVFTILAFIVAGLIIYYTPQIPKQDWSLRWAMSLQLGGALGNLADRLQFGHVTDFISVGKFAVFNVADASISVGLAVLIIGVWIVERREKAEAKQTMGEPLDLDSENTGDG